MKRLIAAAGYPADEIGFDGITFDEMRPGCWQPKARLADMTMNHVEASLCLPELPAVLRPDLPERRRTRSSPACASRPTTTGWSRSGAAGSDGRLIPLCLVPLWDVELAAAEVRRNAARGVRAVAFSELPPWLGLPSIHSGYWDPFFAACAETGTVVAMHIGSGTKTINSSDDAPDAVQATNIFANSALSLIDFLFSGVLVRFPDLKLLYAEAQIGWIPYVLERVDDVWDVHRGWSDEPAQRQRAAVDVLLPPGRAAASSRTASASRTSTASGASNITFETDYPHQDGTWPNTHQVAKELFGQLDADTVHKIVRGNAIRFLGLEGLGDGSGPLPS